MSAFEQAVTTELTWLVRAGVPPRAVRISVRELLVARMERGSLDARDVGDAVESAVRAACRLAREPDVPDDLVDVVCAAALEAVRGHGGLSAQWLEHATRAAGTALDAEARMRPLRARLPRW